MALIKIILDSSKDETFEEKGEDSGHVDQPKLEEYSLWARNTSSYPHPESYFLSLKQREIGMYEWPGQLDLVFSTAVESQKPAQRLRQSKG